MPSRPAKPQKASKTDPLAELWPGQSVPLLKALHILTHNGGLNADSRRKLKQVQHLAQLIHPAIDVALKAREQPVLADLGAGKSYLGFILYDLYFGPAGRGRVLAVESRAELIAEYEDTLANPYIAAERGYVDAVIAPHETRVEVVKALRLLASKRETLPPKKHGNIPL